MTCLPCHSHGLFKVHRVGSDLSVYWLQAVEGKKDDLDCHLLKVTQSTCTVSLGDLVIVDFLKSHAKEKSGLHNGVKRNLVRTDRFLLENPDLLAMSKP